MEKAKHMKFQERNVLTFCAVNYSAQGFVTKIVPISPLLNVINI